MNNIRHIVYIDFNNSGNYSPIECGEMIPQEDGHLAGFILLTDVVNISDAAAPNVIIDDFYIKSSHISYIAKGHLKEDDFEDDYSEEESIEEPPKKKVVKRKSRSKKDI